MRIISGSHKGRRIIAPKKLPVRPTTDMAKEALFNILNNRYYLEDITVLDLFSGTGNISFEFASRGTSHITAVDSYFGCIKFIDQISQDFQFQISTFKSEVVPFLEKHNNTYDIIFADPPYDFDKSKLLELVEIIFSKNLLNDEGVLILEHAKHTDISDLLHYSESKRYGSNIFSFFSK